MFQQVLHGGQRSITLLNHPNSLHPVPSDWQCGCGTQSRKKREHDSFSPTPTSISASLACHQTSAPSESLCYCHSVRRVSRMHGTQSLSALAPGQTKKWHTRIKIFHIVAPSIEDSVNSIVLLWWTFILLWTNSMLAPTTVLKWSDISKKYHSYECWCDWVFENISARVINPYVSWDYLSNSLLCFQ